MLKFCNCCNKRLEFQISSQKYCNNCSLFNKKLISQLYVLRNRAKSLKLKRDMFKLKYELSTK